MRKLIKCLMVITISIVLVACGKGLDWPDNKLSRQIPKPSSGIIEKVNDFESSINITIKDLTQDDFKEYVKDCEKKGFDYATDKSEYGLVAFNDDNYKLGLIFHEGELTITVDESIKLKSVKWPDNNASKLLPTPKFDAGKIEWENSDSFLIYIGNFSRKDFSSYVDSCKSKGFNVDYDKGENYYYANNKSDFRISLYYQLHGEKVMTLKIEKKKDGNSVEQKENTKPNKSSSSKEDSPKPEKEEVLKSEKEKAVSYSTNDRKTAKNGNSGVFSYKSKSGTYDIYWIIDFDEQYVYSFTDGNGDDSCSRLKIDFGTLNDTLVFTWHSGGDEWSDKMHFKYKNQPETLILNDANGFDFEYETTNLKDALEIRGSKTVKDY